MRVPAFLLVQLVVLAASGTAACAGPPAPLQEAPGPRAASPDSRITVSSSGDFTPDDTDALRARLLD
ncbi:hypothetical protein E1266_37385 [Actinomadura sp. 7K534]|nr:hypothetical protein E1266_37385 [Actinomadura sp. 7K534]